MRRYPRILLAAVLLALAAACAAAEDDPLAFSATRWDFGRAAPGAKPAMTLMVTNRGDAAVAVTLLTTCGCLAVEPSRRTIAGGATGTFRITFDATDEPAGPVSRTLVVATDIPGRPRMLFTVTGTIAGYGGTAGEDAPAAGGAPGPAGPITLTYWYSPGCRSCERFLAEELPRLGRELGVAIEVVRRDVLAAGVYEEYAVAAAARGAEVRGIPGLLVGDGPLLQGEDEIRDGLAAALAGVATAPAEAAGDQAAAAARGGSTASFALLPVLAGGLLDGINPCAFTTLVFLLSSLAVAGRGRREVLLLGGLFTLAVFATYFAVGLGLLAGLRAAAAVPVVSRVLRWALVAVLAAFAVLSARDAVLAARGRTSEMALQLPGALKRRIHASIRTRVRSAALAASALGLGFLVSVFEFACTGQVYVPTLAYLARLGDARAVPLLAAYNLAFVAPLLAVFAASWAGVGSRRLGALLQRHLVAVKVCLALFFAGLAALTLAT